jgi:ketosteroid isomerase-like protein
MKLTPIGFALTVLALAAIASAQDADKAQIKKIYAKLTAAMKSRNLAAMEALESKDYSEEAMGQTMNRQEANARMKQEFSAVKSIQSLSIQTLNLKVTGKTATAISKYTMVATVAGPDGKSHLLKAEGKISDDLVKTPSGWLIKHEKDSGSKATMDGKPVKM